MKRFNLIVILIGIILFSACENKITQLAGFLEGTISIGPICPVETIPPDSACLPTAETYKAYPVSIWTSNGKRKITQISPALDGSYHTDLAPGNYQVILENQQIKFAGTNLPVQITIISQDKTLLNINIDTGIR
jgi:hypothetical protein